MNARTFLVLTVLLAAMGLARADFHTSAAGPREDLGVWYAGFDLLQLDGAFDISADIIQMRLDDTGQVDLSIFAAPGASCPSTMHTALCVELRAAADGRGYVRPAVTGARRVNPIDGPGDDFLIAFRLPGDRRDRLLTIGLEATYYSAFIHHPVRGLDYNGYAERRAHLCETSPCSNDVFAALRQNSAPYRGALTGVAWTRALREMPDRIAQSHRRTAPTPVPVRPASNGRSLLTDPWTVFEITDEPLGTVSFAPGPGGLSASGTFTGFFETGRLHETEFRLADQSDQAVAFDLTMFAGGSGERREGRLIVELPSYARGDPRGSLILDDTIYQVYLAQPGGGSERSGSAQHPAREDDLVDPAEPLPEYPVIGIYKYDYRLRDVPPGRELALRYKPSRDSGQVGQIASGAPSFRLHGCAPEIGSLRFEQATADDRLRMLSSAWCEVLLPDARGWIPGRYLQPVEPRP